MAPRPKPPMWPVRPAAPVPTSPYLPTAEVPLPEVIEKNSDSVWALWNDAIGDNARKDADTQPATLLMGLPEPPKDSDTH